MLRRNVQRIPVHTTARRRVTTGVLVTGILLVLLLLVALANRMGSREMTTNSTPGVLTLALPAFLAGLLSFLSPCTLPILPSYFAWTFRTGADKVVQMTIAFFLGLATTMVVLGASASALSQLLAPHVRQLSVIGGVVIVGFGVMNLLGKGFRGLTLHDRPRASLAGSYLYGATFALGWTACVGPILGALLTMLATQGSAVLEGAILAFIYALGLGTPLIVSARFFSRLRPPDRAGSGLWRLMRGRGWTINLGQTTLFLHTSSLASGLLLITTGLLLATNQLAVFSQWSAQTSLAQRLIGAEEAIRVFLLGQ